MLSSSCYRGGGYLLWHAKREAVPYFMLASSVLFYAAQGLFPLLVLCVSLALNYPVSRRLSTAARKKPMLILGIILNILFLCFFKYAPVTLPVGISFYTFQQIAYLVDTSRGETEGITFVEFLLYIFFFPKLLMGPLVSPMEFVTQVRNEKGAHAENLVIGIQMFSLGLLKKVLLADTFSNAVEWGFSNSALASSADLFIVMLSYTFQIYFDFSGYTDMATGISKMLNINLPINFDSPYRATSIRDFWKRWHISLTQFFTKYLYIPLGGNRKGTVRTYFNIMVVFIVSGLWHGTGLTFLLWGSIYGFLCVLERVFDRFLRRIPVIIGWIFTFLTVNVLWLLFRASSVRQWWELMKRIFRFDSFTVHTELITCFLSPEMIFAVQSLHLGEITARIPGFPLLFFLTLAFVICLCLKNNYRRKKSTGIFTGILTGAALTLGLLLLGTDTTFIYNNF